jgi:hypothetical protein
VPIPIFGGMTAPGSRPPWPRLLSLALGLAPVHVVALRAALAPGACDRTFLVSRRWAQRHRIPWTHLERALRGFGARCDCETFSLLSRGYWY